MEKVVIPKELARKGGLVVIPCSEYEEYLRLKKIVQVVEASRSEKKAIKEGRKEIRKGEYLTLQQLKDKIEEILLKFI